MTAFIQLLQLGIKDVRRHLLLLRTCQVHVGLRHGGRGQRASRPPGGTQHIAATRQSLAGVQAWHATRRQRSWGEGEGKRRIKGKDCRWGHGAGKQVTSACVHVY